MAARIIDGKRIAAEIREEVRQRVQRLRETTGKVPGLAVILVGDDPASATYVRSKTKACQEAGILSRQLTPPGDVSQSDLLRIVQELNRDPRSTGSWFSSRCQNTSTNAPSWRPWTPPKTWTASPSPASAAW
jgi:methylenetetrahydrofolate dehydrogenase (NADP+)/methenyltetrahydrofolate cyclohydrolase